MHAYVMLHWLAVVVSCILYPVSCILYPVSCQYPFTCRTSIERVSSPGAHLAMQMHGQCYHFPDSQLSMLPILVRQAGSLPIALCPLLCMQRQRAVVPVLLTA
jgi:hypothetical protein